MPFKLLFPIGFILSLFVFFKTMREDIKLISLRLREETIFDMFFQTAIGALIGARFLFVATHIAHFGLNPLKLILFTHFPGLSPMGGVLGGTVSLIWFLRRQGFPLWRVLDLAALSAMPIVILGFFGNLRYIEGTVLTAFGSLLFFFYQKPTKLPARLHFEGVYFVTFLLFFSVSDFLLDFGGGNARILLDGSVFLVALFFFANKFTSLKL